MKMTINNIYKYYSIIITLILAAVLYFGYDYYNQNQSLSRKVTELNSETTKLQTSIKSQATTRAPEDTKPCQEWIGSNTSLGEGEVCFYDGVKDIQTQSDVQVWSYNDNKWVEPVGTGDPEVATVIRPNDTDLGVYYPVIIKCPWGCTFGYTE